MKNRVVHWRNSLEFYSSRRAVVFTQGEGNVDSVDALV